MTSMRVTAAETITKSCVDDGWKRPV